MLDITAESAPAIIEQLNLISQLSVIIMIIGTGLLTIGIAAIYASRKSQEQIVFLNGDDFEAFCAQEDEQLRRELDRLNDEQIFKNTEKL